MPTGADDGSWGVGVLWRMADGAKTRLSVNAVSRRRLLKLAMAAGARVCWRTADGAMTRLGVNEVSRRHLMELAKVDGVWECVGARLMEL